MPLETKDFGTFVPERNKIYESYSSNQCMTSCVTKESNRRYHCKYEGCLKNFPSKVRLNGHIAQIHTKLLPFSCPKEECNESFSMQTYLNRHLKRHEKSNLGKICKKSFNCTECFEKFDRKLLLRTHLHQIHGETPIHECFVCKKVFYVKYKLDKHFRKVHQKPLHKCHFTQCEYSTEKWTLFRKHIAEHKTNNKCRFCEKSFNRLYNCRAHEREVHFHELNNDSTLNLVDLEYPKLFHCEYDQCKKSYFRKSNLNQHIKCCHKELTFKCTECDKMFGLKHILNNHIKNVHSNAKERRKGRNKSKERDDILEDLPNSKSVDIEKLKLAKRLTSRKTIKQFYGDVNVCDNESDNEKEKKINHNEKEPFAMLCAIAQSSLI